MGSKHDTEAHLNLGFWRRRRPLHMKPASVAQLIQVERLQWQFRLIQMQGSSLPDPQILSVLQDRGSF